MPRGLRDVFVERHIENRSKPKKGGLIRLGCPRRSRHGDHVCRYEIRGFGRMRRGRAFGVDELQALQLAFVALRADLKRLGDEAVWLEEPAYLGVALMSPSLFNVELSEKAEAAIEKIHVNFAERLQKERERL